MSSDSKLNNSEVIEIVNEVQAEAGPGKGHFFGGKKKTDANKEHAAKCNSSCSGSCK